MFSCVWSFGASIDNTGRACFDEFFREILSGPMSFELKDKYHILDMVDGPARPYLCPFPSKGTVYEYRFIKEVKKSYELFFSFSSFDFDFKKFIWSIKWGMHKRFDWLKNSLNITIAFILRAIFLFTARGVWFPPDSVIYARCEAFFQMPNNTVLIVTVWNASRKISINFTILIISFFTRFIFTVF